VTESGACTVVASDVRTSEEIGQPSIDVGRWERLATAVAIDEGGVGELTLTFVDRAEIAELNGEFMGQPGATDVLAFPMDDEPQPGVPVMLGDIVVSPAVAAEQWPQHAGSLDDELALLVVHGVLHVLGHDHFEPAETTLMRERELALLSAHHWHGPVPETFRQTHD
jgi:probable rRNA maturation factor